MAKRVFFSFHYQDVIDFRANVVRNHKQQNMKAQVILMLLYGKMRRKKAI